MLFKYKLITKYLFFVLITMCSGQQYFSPLIPNNYFIPNAADLAKGVIFSGPFSDNIFKDATLQIMDGSYNQIRKVVFKDMFPVGISGIQFSSVVVDTEPVIATATFSYTSYSIE